MNQLATTDVVSSGDRALAHVVDELMKCLAERDNEGVERLLAEQARHADSLRQLLPALEALAQLRDTTLSSEAGIVSAHSSRLAPRDEASMFHHAERDDYVVPPIENNILGDYRILREVGRGGMGIVYEAEQISLSRRVALKILPFAAVLDPRHLQRFKNEALAAAHLDHPNIVEVYGVGCERGVHFYAMRFVEGQTLAAVIDAMKDEGQSTKDENKTPLPLGEGRVRGSGEDSVSGATACLASSDDSLRPSSFVLRTSAMDTSPLAALSTLRTERPKDFFRTVAELGIQAAEALDHAHQMGIVHRDIKPSNLMIEFRMRNDECGMSEVPLPPGEGRVRVPPPSLQPLGSSLRLFITDFGLAHIESDATLTMTGDLLGTLRYMSPEQAEGRAAILDHRTDIYSLGVTLYELLTLRPAFPATDRQTLLRQIAQDEPPSPRKLNTHIPTDLETIVLKAIAKHRDGRYTSVRNLAADLSRFLDQKPIRAKRPSWAQDAWKWTYRHKAGALTGLTVALVIVAACAAIWARRIHEAQDIAQTVRESLAGAASAIEANDLSLAQAKITELVAWSSPHDELPADVLSEIGRLAAEVATRNEDAQRFEQFVQTSERPIMYLGFNRGSEDVSLALKALKFYDVMERTDWFLRLDTMFLHERQRHEILETAYKLLLLLADDSIRLKNDRPTDRPPTERASANAALAYLEKAKSFHDATRGFYYTRAKCYEMLNDVAHWEADSERVVNMLGTMGLDHFFVGRDANHYGGLDQASEELYGALRVEPAHFASWNVVANSLQTQGRHREAILAYSACILLRPNTAALYTARAGSLSEIAQNRQAVFDAEKALTIDQSNVNAHLRRSEAYWKSKNWAKCVADFQEAVRLAPSNAYAKRCLSTFLAKKYTPFYDPPRALDLAKEALRISDNNDRYRPLYFAAIAEASLRVGDWDAVIEAAQRSHDMPNWFDGFNLYFLTIAHWQRGDKEIARRYYEQAVACVKREPDNVELREFHEEAMELMGIKNEALKTGP